MSSIATKTGDKGTTALVGGTRVSKADLQVEAYGTVDELNAFLGFARSICSQDDIKSWTEEIQKDLFRVGSALSTPPDKRKDSIIYTADYQRMGALLSFLMEDCCNGAPEVCAPLAAIANRAVCCVTDNQNEISEEVI